MTPWEPPLAPASLTAPGERIKALEVRQEHMEEAIDKMSIQVDEMHNLLMQAKGARWAIMAMATLGGFVAGVGAKFLPFVGR